MISFRPCSPVDAPGSDRRFVVSAWSASYKDSHSAGMIGMDRWAKVMHPEIARVLDHASTRTLVAYEKSDPMFVYGFISGDTSGQTPVVHYCYTKAAFRRQGIARQLFAALGVNPDHQFIYACRTAVVTRLGGKVPAARFNPNVARTQAPSEAWLSLQGLLDGIAEAIANDNFDAAHELVRAYQQGAA